MRRQRLVTLSTIVLFSVLIMGCHTSGQINRTVEENKLDTKSAERLADEICLEDKETEKKDIAGNEEVKYEDVTHKEVGVGELYFTISQYHVKRKKESADQTIFYCERDAESSRPEKTVTIKAQQLPELEIKDFEDAQHFFSGITDCERLKSYQNMENEVEVATMYEAMKKGNYYTLVYYKDSFYLFESEYHSVGFDLLKRFYGKYVEDEYRKDVIKCADNQLIEITTNICYSEKKANYEIYKSTGEMLCQLELQVEKIHIGHRYCLNVYDAEDKLIQTLEWEALTVKYLEFDDIDLNGYPDIKGLQAEGTTYNTYNVYLWKPETQVYEKVIYEDGLAEMEPKEGYVINRYKNGEMWTSETLEWDGNRLIKISEESFGPDTEK